MVFFIFPLLSFTIEFNKDAAKVSVSPELLTSLHSFSSTCLLSTTYPMFLLGALLISSSSSYGLYHFSSSIDLHCLIELYKILLHAQTFVFLASVNNMSKDIFQNYCHISYQEFPWYYRVHHR